MRKGSVNLFVLQMEQMRRDSEQRAKLDWKLRELEEKQAQVSSTLQMIQTRLQQRGEQ
ncbi:hypothetical protein ACLM5H_24605 [Fredinandcohnia humi]